MQATRRARTAAVSQRAVSPRAQRERRTRNARVRAAASTLRAEARSRRAGPRSAPWSHLVLSRAARRAERARARTRDSRLPGTFEAKAKEGLTGERPPSTHGAAHKEDPSDIPRGPTLARPRQPIGLGCEQDKAARSASSEQNLWPVELHAVARAARGRAGRAARGRRGAQGSLVATPIAAACRSRPRRARAVAQAHERPRRGGRPTGRERRSTSRGRVPAARRRAQAAAAAARASRIRGRRRSGGRRRGVAAARARVEGCAAISGAAARRRRRSPSAPRTSGELEAVDAPQRARRLARERVPHRVQLDAQSLRCLLALKSNLTRGALRRHDLSHRGGAAARHPRSRTRASTFELTQFSAPVAGLSHAMIAATAGRRAARHDN